MVQLERGKDELLVSGGLATCRWKRIKVTVLGDNVNNYYKEGELLGNSLNSPSPYPSESCLFSSIPPDIYAFEMNIFRSNILGVWSRGRSTGSHLLC